MRIPSSVSIGLVVASAIVSVMLWRDLRTERQLVTDLRTELDETKAALAAKPQPQPAVAALPQPSTTESAPINVPAVPDAAALKAATATLVAQSAQRQKAMLEDTEYRKARIAQVRANMQLRFPNLAKDLGLSEKEADALITLLAEGQIREEKEITDRMASLTASPGSQPDPAAIAELTRVQKELQQRQKDAIAALLGPTRAAEYQEYEQTAPSRQRITNLTTMLGQAGKPLSAEQSRSLGTLMIAEQRRREIEAQAGPVSMQESGERAIASDRRVLEGAMGFLDSQQIELVRARFEQVASRQRANDRVNQKTMENMNRSGE